MRVLSLDFDAHFSISKYRCERTVWKLKSAVPTILIYANQMKLLTYWVFVLWAPALCGKIELQLKLRKARQIRQQQQQQKLCDYCIWYSITRFRFLFTRVIILWVLFFRVYFSIAHYRWIQCAHRTRNSSKANGTYKKKLERE